MSVAKTRKCKKCSKRKPMELFPLEEAGKTWRKYTCKECDNKRRRSQYDREAMRWKNIFRLYGVTREQWLALFEAQGNCCACCRRSEPVWLASDNRTGWHIDHDHATKQLRGILCNGCNVMIGGAQDDPSVLEAGAAYLYLTRSAHQAGTATYVKADAP